MRGVFLLGLLIGQAAMGCAPDSSSESAPHDTAPEIDVAPNPNSSLSAIVSFDAPGATTAHVVSTASSGVETLKTPDIPIQKGHGRITVLGLAPDTSYRHAVYVTDTSGTRELGSVEATSGSLPDELSELRISVNTTGQTPPGYFLVSGSGTFVFAFDPSGTIRWYKGCDDFCGETKIHPGGTYTSHVGSAKGFEPIPSFYELYEAGGDLLTKYVVKEPHFYTDAHELLLTGASSTEALHFIGYEIGPTGPGGAMQARHALFRQTPGGEVEFRWNSWSYFTSQDYVNDLPIPQDFDHMNALAIDPSDQNYVVSFRNFDALVKIDARSAKVLWQFGGRRSQFTLQGDPGGPFSGQHSVWVLPNGNILVYDNGNNANPPESRAVEFRLDTRARTATLVWEYRHDPPLYTRFQGSVERRTNGNTVVAFTGRGVVTEVDADARVVWEARLTSDKGGPEISYRIRPLASLSDFEAP